MHWLAPFNLLYTATGFFVGLLVGQTGMGGGSLVTPILVLVFGVAPATAVGTDLLYASITKAVGTAVHGAHHTVRWPIVARLAAGSVPSTIATLVVISHFNLNSRVRFRVITTALGVMLLITAVALLFRRRLLSLGGNWLELVPERRDQQADHRGGRGAWSPGHRFARSVLVPSASLCCFCSIPGCRWLALLVLISPMRCRLHWSLAWHT